MPHANGSNLPQGLAIVNNDGFSLHYPEDLNTLTGLSSHFRRMQGLDPPLVIQNSTNVVAIVLSVLAAIVFLVGGYFIYRWRSRRGKLITY
jgi:cytochrome b subunit of formate dehydrogenase